MKKIILASTSPRRKELLAKTGLVFEVASSDYEEDMTLNLPPRKLTMELSSGKAKSVASKFPNSIIIAADTLIYFEGKVLGKPKNAEDAKETLKRFSGKSHVVITGFTILDTETGKTFSKAVETEVFFKRLTIEHIKGYVATGEALNVAGSYAIQGLGKYLVEKTEGSSRDNVAGLPVEEVMEALKDFGITV